MATITLKLDTRRANAGGRYPIQFQLPHNSKCTTISTGISIRSEYWIGEINKAAPQCPNAKALNSDLEALYFKYSNALRQMEVADALTGMHVTDIRKILTDNKIDNKIAVLIHFQKFHLPQRQ